MNHILVKNQKNRLYFQLVLSELIVLITYFLLIFLPFQKFIYKYFFHSNFILYIDEFYSIFFIIIFMLFIIIFKKVNNYLFNFFIILLIFAFIGLLSSLINFNSLYITFLGIFDYIKGFLFILGLSILYINKKHLLKIYKLLLYLSIFLVFIALLQELMFLLHLDYAKLFVKYSFVRFGFLRTPSLLSHPNIFGLYILLFFTLNLFITKKYNFINLFLLLGIFLSFSKFVWLSTLLIILINFFTSKHSIKIKLIFLIILLIIIVSTTMYFIKSVKKELFSDKYFRGYALKKSFQIWNDYFILGVGPGKFGGVISIKFKSDIYRKYNFSTYWYDIMINFNSIDQFWPQLFAELGIWGVLSFLIILLYLVILPLIFRKKCIDKFLKNFLQGLSVIPFIIIIYCFSSGLNMSFFLITYSIFLGSALGVCRYENFIDKQILIS